MDVVKCLLLHGADVNTRRTDGKTPLHCAAEFGYAEVIEALLASGADPLRMDVLGRTALQLTPKWHGVVRALLIAAEGRAKLLVPLGHPPADMPQPVPFFSLDAARKSITSPGVNRLILTDLVRSNRATPGLGKLSASSHLGSF